MEKTFKEKVLSKFQKITKRHKYLKLPMVVCIAVILGVYHFIEYFASNGKRFASLVVIMLFYTISCSFSFPGFADGTVQEGISAIDGEYDYDSQVKLVNEDEVQMDDMELLDDADMLEGFDDQSLCSTDDVDKYTLDEILEENSQYSGEITEQETETGKEVVFDKNDWRLVLINKQHPIPEDYTFTLGTIKGSMKCDERIIGDLLAMFQAAKEDGVNLVVCSPYRDLSRQEMLFERKIKAYMQKGMSYMEAYSFASQTVTVPGASEHQIGLAIDIISDTYTSLDAGFANTEAGKWLAEHSCEYGFILRYPLGKEYITGIEYEPWHFRYVGKDAATAITEQGICLEEFVEGL